MSNSTVNIDHLIGIVLSGGKIKTGVDIFNQNGVLLLDQNVLVDSVKTLTRIKENGITSIPVFPQNNGGLWDSSGNPVVLEKQEPVEEIFPDAKIVQKMEEIKYLKDKASQKYTEAKSNIKKVISDIKSSGGQFEYSSIEDTVSDLVEFLTVHENGFSYLTREIFSYDDYLYNHSVNVCTIGTAIISRFNRLFSDSVNNFLASTSNTLVYGKTDQSFLLYSEKDIHDIATGFFLHDLGKVLIPETILNKKGKLTADEFKIVKTHSYEKGLEILKKNNINNPIIENIVTKHHANIFKNEGRCYPPHESIADLPPYVKICKIADIYDAMTSKRSYKQAFNPISVVTEIFRNYAKKDNLLQYILHSFIKSIGIYPPGSVVHLSDKTLGYILDSQGPLVIKFTDSEGNTLPERKQPLNITESDELNIDSSVPLVSPAETYSLLPDYLKSDN